MFTWYSVWLLPLLTVLAGPKSCPPKLDVISTQSCCKLPLMNFKSYEKPCGKLEILGAQDWPCGFECIFKIAHALNGTRLDMEKVEKMLNEVFKEHQPLVKPFVEAFDGCVPLEAEMVKTLKKRRLPSAKCSHLAMLYGICAYKHVFIHCPENYWTNSTHCNRIKTCELNRVDKN